MRKHLNPIFFSITFLAALVAEIYCIQILEGDLISVIGIGCVLLINFYLLLDSIRGQLIQGRDRTKFYLEQLYREEVEKSGERYTEVLNLLKASYTAAKKNGAMMEEKQEELLLRLTAMEKSNTLALQKVAEYQKKLMEGQKKALNIELNYNKENTKLLIVALKKELGKLKQEEQLSLILDALKGDRESFGEPRKDESISEHIEDFPEAQWMQEVLTDGGEIGFLEDELEDENPQEEDAETGLENNSEEAKPEAQDIVHNIEPLYDDPNKALTADEIATLFASYGK